MRTLAKLSFLLVAAVLVCGSRAHANAVGSDSLQVVFTVTIDGYNSIAWEDGTTNPINLTIHNPNLGFRLQYDCSSNGGLKEVMNTSQNNTTSNITVSQSATGLNLAEPLGSMPQLPDVWGTDSSIRTEPMVLNPGCSSWWSVTILTPIEVTHNHTGSITITLTATAP